MLKVAAAALCVAAVAASAVAAPVPDWKAVSKTLDGIPSAAGMSVGKRLATCKIIVHKDATWIETLTTDQPQYGAKAGETVLQLKFDMPTPPSSGGPAPKSQAQKNVTALWIIDHGKATAVSNWANVLQNRPVPLGYDASTNC